MKEFKVNDRVIISNPKQKQFLKGRHGTIAEIDKSIKIQVDDIGEWYLNAYEIEHEGKIKLSEPTKSKTDKSVQPEKENKSEGIKMIWETEKAELEPKKEKRAYNRKPKDEPIKPKRKYSARNPKTT